MIVYYSVNQYDSDGDSFDNCLMIHIDKNTILRLNDKNDLSEFIEQLRVIRIEIEDK